MTLISLEDAKAEVRKVVSDFKTRYDINYRLNSLPSIELEDEAEQTEPQTIRCPKCGRGDYIREFGKDFSVTAEEAGFKYKCINCNTYIEPQSDRKTENCSEKPNNCEEYINNLPWTEVGNGERREP